MPAAPPSVYPELFALTGPNVPDYRGMFLRGQGGSSAALGVTQDSAAKIGGDGKTTLSMGGKRVWVGTTSGYGQGGNDQGWYELDTYNFLALGQHSEGSSMFGGWNNTVSYLDTMGVTDIPIEIKTEGGADETRPVNVAVRYLIRAKP